MAESTERRAFDLNDALLPFAGMKMSSEPLAAGAARG
jgi:hypothetical protein